MAGNSELQNVCGICLSHFTEPKILPCFHTFCMECLENNLRVTSETERFTCPTCRTTISVPTGGVKSFQTNFYVTSKFAGNSVFDCDACGKTKIARHKCKECNQNFCELCSNVHLRMSSSREHNLIHLSHLEDTYSSRDHANTYCVKHPSEVIAVVCKDCNELLCQVCRETLHSEHSCVEISVQARETRQKLRELADISEDNLRDIENDIRVVKRQAEAKHAFFNDEMTALRNKKDALISNISAKFKSFEDEIQKINNEQKMLSNEIITNQKLKTTNIKQTIDQSKNMIERADDTRILRNCDDLLKKLSEIKVTLTPAVPGHNLMENVQNCTSWLIKLNEQYSKI